MSVASKSPPVARPFVKWAGGKTQILPEILARVPARFGKYVEPFIGGGAVFWALGERGRGAVLADANPELAAAYRGVRRDVGSVVKELRAMKDAHDEAHYLRVRALDPIKMSDGRRAARLIYLNKTCFNGLYRVNKAGQFNVPMNRGANPRTVLDEDNLRACSEALREVTIVENDFEAVRDHVERGDFVYLDPPYLPRTETSDFTSFTAGGFGRVDHVRLARFAKELKGRGARVLLSNAGTEEVRKIYDDVGGFTIDVVRARRNVNSVGDCRGKVSEFLIY